MRGVRRWLGVIGAAVGIMTATPGCSILQREPEVVHTLPETCPMDADRAVVVHKSERALGLYLGRRLVSVYHISLGEHPEGHKQRMGDGRTPEGLYAICTRNPKSRFDLFLGFSYPRVEDADAALREGRITMVHHAAIAAAHAAEEKPPWETPLGGAIGIHGGGTHGDWTSGCIAVSQSAIEELDRELRMGDTILIEP